MSAANLGHRSPLIGTVVAVNDALNGTPELLNQDPYGSGWLCEIEMSNDSELDDLLDSVGYEALTAG